MGSNEHEHAQSAGRGEPEKEPMVMMAVEHYAPEPSQFRTSS